MLFKKKLEYYSEKQMDAIDKHIGKYIGHCETVSHEEVSFDIHVDICIINPTAERNYYSLVTMGMGAHKMNLPKGVDKKFARAEIIVTLPPDWDIYSKDEKWYWPIRWLITLARVPIYQNTWLGYGHTVPNGEPFADDTKLCCAMLTLPYSFSPDTFTCKLPDRDEVKFYQMIPLYEEEVQYKINNGAEALEELFGDDFQMAINKNRTNYADKQVKQ